MITTTFLLTLYETNEDKTVKVTCFPVEYATLQGRTGLAGAIAESEGGYKLTCTCLIDDDTYDKLCKTGKVEEKT